MAIPRKEICVQPYKKTKFGCVRPEIRLRAAAHLWYTLGMREIDNNTVIEAFAAAIDGALKKVDARTVGLLETALEKETNEHARFALRTILENDRYCDRTAAYPCQDTGLAVVFADIGEGVVVKNLQATVDEAVRRGYQTARKSVADPLTRLNTGDNTPAIVHMRQVAGDRLTLSFLAKGAGSENMSRIYMLPPSRGRQGIVDSVVDCVKIAGANPCPPIIVGVGVGGNFETAALLSKRALIETDRPEPELEAEILAAVNATGIGAQGFGGNTTALEARVLTYPTHIGMLPVAVNVQCHSVRHCTVTFF